MGGISSRTVAYVKEVTAFRDVTYFEGLFPLADIFITFSCLCIILRKQIVFFCLLWICFSIWCSERPHIMDKSLTFSWHRHH